MGIYLMAFGRSRGARCPNNNRICRRELVGRTSQENFNRNDARQNKENRKCFTSWFSANTFFPPYIDGDWRKLKPLCAAITMRGYWDGGGICKIVYRALYSHVDDERMTDLQQNVLFTFNMLCLLLLYNINNWQNFNRIVRRFVASLRAQCNHHPTESSSA